MKWICYLTSKQESEIWLPLKYKHPCKNHYNALIDTPDLGSQGSIFNFLFLPLPEEIDRGCWLWLLVFQWLRHYLSIPNKLHLLFLFTTFRSSCFIPWQSFSSSTTRAFTSSIPSDCAQPTWRRFCEFSRFSEIKNKPEIDVRSRSCSKKRTCTMTRRGSLSFWAAWVLASNDNFWQFISLHICSRSKSVSQGCACRSKYMCEQCTSDPRT